MTTYKYLFVFPEFCLLSSQVISIPVLTSACWSSLLSLISRTVKLHSWFFRPSSYTFSSFQVMESSLSVISLDILIIFLLNLFFSTWHLSENEVPRILLKVVIIKYSRFDFTCGDLRKHSAFSQMMGRNHIEGFEDLFFVAVEAVCSQLH